MFQTKVVEKMKTHTLCSVTFIENQNIYEINSKKIVVRGSHRWQYSAYVLRAGYL